MLISLIGEQPIPILLADRALQPTEHILVHSERTRHVAQNLQALLPHARPEPLGDAYDFGSIHSTLERLATPDAIFHLSSGTKPMAWAGYEVARQTGATVVYLESEHRQSVLYRFAFDDQGVHQTKEVLPRLIDLEQYLRVHGLEVRPSQPLANEQEVALNRFLQAHTDSCLHNLKYPVFEIDFLIQRGNQVAVVEAKSGLSKNVRKRKGLDQLTTITGREYLGTYTGRIWVVEQIPGTQLQDLAAAYAITIVQVTVVENRGRYRLDAPSQKRLAKTLDDILGAR